jgi:hypothetical protein
MTTGEPRELSLLGGPLYRLGRRLGLVRGGSGSAGLALVLGPLPWALLVALALLEGHAGGFFSLALVAGHLRLLVVIPLLFFCEAVLDPQLRGFSREIVRAGVVPGRAQADFDRLVERTGRCRDAWLPEALCLLAALLLPLLGGRLEGLGATAVYDPTHALAPGSLAAHVYWFGVLAIFRFLVFRWLWKLVLWWHFLWRLSRLELHLVPTHPDGAAGLGLLELIQTSFASLVAALSVLQAGALAEELAAGGIAFAEVYPWTGMVAAIGVALVAAPLLFFGPKLWACKVRGLAEYGELAARYVHGFDRKWLRGAPPEEPLLGTADLQSLADLTNSFRNVRDMHWIPASPRLLVVVVMAAVLPMLPLLLFEFPLDELVRRLFQSLTGL